MDECTVQVVRLSTVSDILMKYIAGMFHAAIYFGNECLLSVWAYSLLTMINTYFLLLCC